MLHTTWCRDVIYFTLGYREFLFRAVAWGSPSLPPFYIFSCKSEMRLLKRLTFYWESPNTGPLHRPAECVGT